ncbi:MAG: ABC transporter ATP-binding protein [Deltaproteobacteria bacterium]|nr:ABC transporter ATP-binding protein [Deltaproteobacteria bacterium]
MNSSVAISVRRLGKRYTLYQKPQDRLKQSLFRHFGKRYGREFWALRNVSFDVRQGETLGVIGRNGSGKSTLLQILAGTTTATEGELKVQGRVSALLELGSGFNPEYTGRENIFMNGAIMGIPRERMARQIDQIISFADIGEFIDQPVKLYSSGMFVRLAFAVTTSLEANILLIDAALAVGDVFFRQKCYQRLEELREHGVVIILVSHAMGKRYYLMEQDDRLSFPRYAGDLPPAKSARSSPAEPPEAHFWPPPETLLPLSGISQVSNGWARCTGVALCNAQGQPCHVFQQGETASFFFEFEILHDLEVPTAGVELQNERGIIVHGKSTLEYGSDIPTRVPRGSRLRFRQDISLEIAVGEYTFNVGLGSVSLPDFQNRGKMLHQDLDAKLARLCMLTHVGIFAVGFRRQGDPVQLLHHGVANLPGECRVAVEPPPGDTP